MRTGVREGLRETESPKLLGGDRVGYSPIDNYLQLTARHAFAGLLGELSAEFSFVVHGDPRWPRQLEAGAGEDRDVRVAPGFLEMRIRDRVGKELVGPALHVSGQRHLGAPTAEARGVAVPIFVPPCSLVSFT